MIAKQPDRPLTALAVVAFGIALLSAAGMRPPVRATTSIRNATVDGSPATLFPFQPIGWAYVIGAWAMAVTGLGLALARPESLKTHVIGVAGTLLFGFFGVLLVLQRGRTESGIAFTPDGLGVQMRGGAQFYPWDALRAVELRNLSTRYARDNPLLTFDGDLTRARVSRVTRVFAVLNLPFTGSTNPTVGVRRLECEPRLVVELAEAMIADPAARRRLGSDELLAELRRRDGVPATPSRLLRPT